LKFVVNFVHFCSLFVVDDADVGAEVVEMLLLSYFKKLKFADKKLTF